MARVRQNISSDSLFHFIRQRDWLLEILKNKSFQARYVYEDIPEISYKVGIPMKCFCDIPLGMIKKHLTSYGKYGIGITKEYAKRYSFSPVIYIHENSDTLKRYLKNINNNNIFKNSDSLLPYFKIDESTHISSIGNKIIDRYYDEREWRYIPPEPEFLDFSKFDMEMFQNVWLLGENQKLDKDPTKYALPFEYDDITYIFVQRQIDVDSVIKEIHKIKIEQIEQDRLISKIITSEQIERDF
jgi:hypothetical protein